MTFAASVPRGVMANNNLSALDLIYGVGWTTNATASSQAYPAANLALYVPIIVPRQVTIYEGFVLSGTLTTSNTVQVALYDEAGVKIVGTSDFTVAVASVIVNSSANLTDTVVTPGRYYLGFGCSGTRNFFASVPSTAGTAAAGGVCEQTGLTGSTLPGTATFATTTRAYVPVFGLNVRATAL